MGTEIKILNSTFEISLRFLAILTVCNYSFSEERLRAYSYYSIHLSDCDSTKNSAHPNIPYRFNNYLGTKEIMHPAIHLLITKRLIDCIKTSHGIRYSVNDLGKACLSIICGPYKDKLFEAIQEVDRLLSEKEDEQIRIEISSNLSSWGAEFTDESLLKDIDDEE